MDLHMQRKLRGWESEFLGLLQLERVIAWIAENMEPHEVFSEEQLSEWATGEGFVEKDVYGRMNSNTDKNPRIRNIVKALGLKPISGHEARVNRFDLRWWITGCVGGDHLLPNGNQNHTFDEALDAAEAWIEDKGRRRGN